MIRKLRHNEFKAASGSISNISNLAKALDLTDDDFELVWQMPEEDRYKCKLIPKTSGEDRVIYNPCHHVRKIQRRINTRIFSNPHVIQWPDYLYGSIPSSKNVDDENRSRDYVSCARRHCQAKSLLKLDIKNFFDNIHDDLVNDIFTNVLNYPEHVSGVLTRICTHNSSLVQGALTSSYIAMLSLHRLEGDVVSRLRKKNLVYTRFVDDITISSKASNYDFTYAIRLVEQMLTEKGLQLNSQKTKIQYSSSVPLTVHGLRICFPEPRLPADEVRRIRAAVQNLEIVAHEKNYRQTYPYRKDFNRCMGRVNKLARVRHSQHKKLISRLNHILPLPSKREIDYIKPAVDKLEAIFNARKGSYWYRAFYFRVGDRLSLIKRSYPSLAAILRKRLKEIKPEYE